MAAMTIRAARRDDAGRIATLWNPIIRDTLVTFESVEKSAAGIRGLLAEKEAAGYAFLVAEAPKALCGFATYSQFRAGAGYRATMENTVQLAPEARGQGIGRALMEALEDHARRAGVHCMIAGISAANPGAVAFHAALGYAQVARLPEVGRKCGRRLDLVLMQKMLAARPDFATIRG